MQGLDWQRLEYTFSKGLNAKTDPRLVEAPDLVLAENIEFDEVGGLRLRFPYGTTSVGVNIVGGGTLSSIRRVYANGDELLCFTKESLYSWSVQLAGWVSRATHLATKIDEKPVFVTTGDQVQCDRAQLNGVVVYTWVDLAAGSSVSGTVYYAVVDQVSGATIIGPTAITGAVTRPRVIALSTKFLIFYVTSTPTLLVRSLDPATLTLSGATTVLGANFNSVYDAVREGTTDTAVYVAKRNPTTSYDVGTVTAALVVTTSTKARTCDGAMAVSYETGGSIVQVIRANGTNVQGDKLSGALADVTTAQAVGTTTVNAADFIAACHRADTRCYVFWTDDVTSGVRNVKYNHVNTAGTIGTEATFLRRVEVASRAFTYNGSVFVNLQFAGVSTFLSVSTVFNELRTPLQNTTFLYRDDGFLAAKQASTKAGDYSATGYLPGVAVGSDAAVFYWCTTERRIVPISIGSSGGGAYADRGPRDITITFDSNAARRVAKLGNTLYVSGGEILQYDGAGLYEVGYHVYPYRLAVGEAAAGSISTNGDYAYRGSYRWDNAKGERDRSTTATSGSAPIAAQPGSFDVTQHIPLFITHKTNRPVAVELWRTAVDPTADAPFYLVTGQDPTDVSGSNCYIPNDTAIDTFATFNDDFTDTTLTTKESNGENDGVLENLAPPAATLIVANDTRLFLAGVPGDPHRVWYSKQREDGQVAAFHDALVVAVPEQGGDITGLAFLNETLVVFRETAIYALDGLGFDNTGGGQNYAARLVSSDIGARSQESICLTPMGLVFLSSKGWQLLNRGWTTNYVGAGTLEDDTIQAVQVMEDRHQIRIVTDGRIVIADYFEGAPFKWAEWLGDVESGVGGCIWSGVHIHASASAIKHELTSYATADYGWDIETLIHLGSLQGFSRVRRLLLLGECAGAGTIRVRVGGYTEDSYFDDKTWTISPTTIGAELEVEHGPSRPQMKAVRIRLTSHTTAGAKPKLSAITLEVGFKNPTFRHLPAAQRQ